MVRLNTISVSNFKNISSAEVSFKDFNVIVGPNGSGKSNFLKILSFLNFIINGANDEVEEYMVSGYNSVFHFVTPEHLFTNKAIKTTFIINFSDWGGENVYEYQLDLCRRPDAPKDEYFALSISKEVFTYKVKTKKGIPTTLFHRAGNKIKYNEEIKKLAVIDEVSSSTSALKVFNIILKKLPESVKKGIDSINALIQSDVLYLSNHAIKSYSSIESYSDNRLISFKLVDQIIALRKGPYWEDFLTVIKEVASIDRIGNVELEKLEDKKRPTIFFGQYGKPGQILTELSDGTLLMLGIITRVFSTSNTTLFIEEPENSIHPRSLQSLISFLKSMSFEKQFIISTHSASLLNMVSPDEVLVCQLDEKGMSNISNIQNPKDLKKRLNEGYVSFGDLLYSNMEEF